MQTAHVRFRRRTTVGTPEMKSCQQTDSFWRSVATVSHSFFLPFLQYKDTILVLCVPSSRMGFAPPLPLQPFLFRRSAIQNSHFPNSWGKHKIHFTTGCSRHPSTNTALRGHRNIIRKYWHKRIRCIVFIDNVKAEP